MPKSAIKRYQIKEGHKVRLSEINPGEHSIHPGLSKKTFLPVFDALRDELQTLQKVLYAQSKHRVLVIIQAMDTGGKDGCVKHAFSRIDPQGINITSFKKPSGEELAHDFLWRVHKRVPGNGEIVVFNRSHYEDIIAVRVKDIFPKSVWNPRHHHIIEFERMLAEEGTTIIKFFLHISKDEQKKRLQARLDNPAKHWKFNPDDLKDRARWPDFMHAYEDLINRTSTKHAPWYIIPANRKWYRNLIVAQIMVETLTSLDMDFPPHSWDAREMTID